jgi:hypothetical protein
MSGLELLTAEGGLGLYRHLTTYPKPNGHADILIFSDSNRSLNFHSWNWCPEIDCHKVLFSRLRRAYDFDA